MKSVPTIYEIFGIGPAAPQRGIDWLVAQCLRRGWNPKVDDGHIKMAFFIATAAGTALMRPWVKIPPAHVDCGYGVDVVFRYILDQCEKYKWMGHA